MSVAVETSLFLKACRGEPTGRTPLWMMRQAGRYLPEYRALRAQHEFLELCSTPELAAEVTVQPIRRFGFDAAILFSDILLIARAMGMEVDFQPGPVFRSRIETAADVEALETSGAAERLAFVPGAVRAAKELLAGTAPLIGFAGAPFTVATYMVEGGGSRNFERIKSLLFTAPETAASLLDKLVSSTAEYLTAQAEAGADALMIFDTHAGLLAPEEFDLYVAGPVERLARKVAHLGKPIIYYSNGTAAALARIAKLPVQVVGLDFRVDIGAARDILGPSMAVQGNLDPAALLGTPAEVRRRAKQVLDSNAGRPGHIFNLGHGILPTASIECVEALVETVHGWRKSS
jgi:uroporphyrinogen decarboxylase